LKRFRLSLKDHAQHEQTSGIAQYEQTSGIDRTVMDVASVEHDSPSF
jgi:hypothetical protein